VAKRNDIIYVSNSQNKVKLPKGIGAVVKKCCGAVLDDEGITDSCEISLTFIDNEKIAQLNSKFRNNPNETDVLSFPAGENKQYDTDPEGGRLILGDIAISAEKALAQSVEYNHSLQREIGFLTVHSMYHLLGYDHVNSEEEREIMHGKEKNTLDRIKLTRDL
jgi:probable rRNA maturation factor